MAAPEIEAFTDTCLTLIRQASEYNAGGIYNADTDANIRQVRTVANALLQALTTITVFRPPPS